MREKTAMFIINILKNTVNVYFNTFFVFYFFKVANYEVLPLAKYYLSLYFFIGVGFILIRNAMKKNIKVPYFRIGISMQALYISLIMILKESIINNIYIVGIVKGIADGFYHFPKNILNTEKVSNESRQKFDGVVSIVNRIISIIIPLVLGVLLSFWSYIDLGKVFFLLFIVMFIVSFWIKDEYYTKKKFEFKKLFRLAHKNKSVALAMSVPFLSGFTYSSGVMGTIMSLAKINNFKTNLNLGYVDSICAALSLLVAVLFTAKIKKKNFDVWMYISGVISLITLFAFAVHPSLYTLISYLIIRNSLIKLMESITDNAINDLSNCEEMKDELKPEFYCARDVAYSISRCFGYIILLIVCSTIGMDYISYILFLPAIALLAEGIVVGKICRSYK